MAVGEGARQPSRRSWCNRPAGSRRPGLLQGGDVEAGEMEDLQQRRDRPAGAVRFGASMRRPAAICTSWLLPSPAESCTRQSRSRSGLRPMVSVSTATTAPRRDRRADRRDGDECSWSLISAFRAPGKPASLRNRSAAGFPNDGAQEKTRTSTTSRPQVPETCASTNSATWASGRGLSTQPSESTNNCLDSGGQIR